MKTFRSFARMGRTHLGRAIAPAVLMAICLLLADRASGQVAVSGWQNGFTLAAGGTASGYYLGYGERKIVGPAVFVDADTRHHIGVEAEARWLLYPQTANVHDTTWLIGPRYSLFTVDRKFYPYAKGLVGLGQFNFPYNYAKGTYLVVAPGGGLDYRLSHRVRLRLVDFEYQLWPKFTYGNMSSYGISTGLRVRIF